MAHVRRHITNEDRQKLYYMVEIAKRWSEFIGRMRAGKEEWYGDDLEEVRVICYGHENGYRPAVVIYDSGEIRLWPTNGDSILYDNIYLDGDGENVDYIIDIIRDAFQSMGYNFRDCRYWGGASRGARKRKTSTRRTRNRVRKYRSKRNKSHN